MINLLFERIQTYSNKCAHPIHSTNRHMAHVQLTSSLRPPQPLSTIYSDSVCWERIPTRAARPPPCWSSPIALAWARPRGLDRPRGCALTPPSPRYHPRAPMRCRCRCPGSLLAQSTRPRAGHRCWRWRA